MFTGYCDKLSFGQIQSIKLFLQSLGVCYRRKAK